MPRVSIVASFGDNESDATSGIVHVAFVSGYNVQMKMLDRLACALSMIESDIVPIRFEFFIQPAFYNFQEFQDVSLLLFVEIKPVGDMELWDDQRMTRIYWKTIHYRQSRIVFLDNPANNHVTKRTFHDRQVS